MAKSLQTEFVKYYKEKLEPFGFQKVKGRQPYFVRVINDEIIHVITYIGTKSTKQGYKAFHLVCGVATVYRKEINFSVSPSHNSDWLIGLARICEKMETEYPVLEFPRDLKIFSYNDDNLFNVIEDTYEGIKILVGELDKVSNMDEFFRHVLKFVPKDLTFKSAFDDGCFDEEGLYYVRKEYTDEKIVKIFEDKRMDLESSGRNYEDKQKTKRLLFEWEEELKLAKKEFIQNGKDYSEGMKLLKAHYEQNIDKLIEYGFDVQKREIDF